MKHVLRIVLISVLTVVLLASSITFAASMVLTPWLGMAVYMPDIEPNFLPWSLTRSLTISAIALLPSIIIATLTWRLLENTVESYWSDRWNRWQAWKAQIARRAS